MKSEKQGTELANAVVRVGGREFITSEQCGIALEGLTLKPFTRYEVSVIATDNFGNRAEGKTHFMTGRRELPWTAKWITNASYTFPKNASPAPFTFRKIFAAKKIKRALLTATALGSRTKSPNLSAVRGHTGAKCVRPGKTYCPPQAYWKML